MITTSRSAMVTRQRCPRERWLAYHDGVTGEGWQRKSGQYELVFGTAIHEMLSEALTRDGTEWHQIPTSLLDALDTLVADQPSHVAIHTREEQLWLARLLVAGWRTYRRPSIRQQYTVRDVEIEQAVVLHPRDYFPQTFADTLDDLQVPIRFDAVLEPRHSANIVVLDFKTANQTSVDWAAGLENSLQSNLYVRAAELLYPQQYCEGVQYEGLVKGKRQLDEARSSPYQGYVIQYGSFLYAWKDRAGKLHKEYTSGRTRQFIPDMYTLNHSDPTDVETMLRHIGEIHSLPSYFPSSVPWRPLTVQDVVAQQVAAENRFMSDVWFYRALPAPMQSLFEGALFEQSLSNCYKYGSKHPCQFVDVCHGGMYPATEPYIFEPRINHHGVVD